MRDGFFVDRPVVAGELDDGQTDLGSGHAVHSVGGTCASRGAFQSSVQSVILELVSVGEGVASGTAEYGDHVTCCAASVVQGECVRGSHC